MKQYRITTENFLVNDSLADDCYLAPDDPIHEIKARAVMGGLGADIRVNELRLANRKLDNK